MLNWCHVFHLSVSVLLDINWKVWQIRSRHLPWTWKRQKLIKSFIWSKEQEHCTFSGGFAKCLVLSSKMPPSVLPLKLVLLFETFQVSEVSCACKDSSLSHRLHSNIKCLDVVPRCNHRPQALQVYHSDEGRAPRLSETLLVCSVCALRSPRRWSPCRCQQTAVLSAAGHRW